MNKWAMIINLCVFSATYAFAQSPYAMKYQAVARDASGSVISDQMVSFRISILQGNISGNAAYVESQLTSTNSFGLVNLEIGNGNPIDGNFETIEWGVDAYFIQVELDAGGGDNYVMMGVSQLMSVPYALHAKTVEHDAVEDADASPTNELQNLSLNGDTLFISDGNYIIIPGLSSLQVDTTVSHTDLVQQRLDDGEHPLDIFFTQVPLDSLFGKTYQGGLIFHLDTVIGTGLVAATTDQTEGEWCHDLLTLGAFGKSIGTGRQNTSTIIEACHTPNTAAHVCDELSLNGYDDWFLPSLDELRAIYDNLFLNGYGGFINEIYWSSTEEEQCTSFYIFFFDGSSNIDSKDNAHYV